MGSGPAATQGPALQPRTLISVSMHSTLTFATSFLHKPNTSIMVSSNTLLQKIKLIEATPIKNELHFLVAGAKDSLQRNQMLK